MGDQPWITATSTFNYMLKDPLLDWLNLYGRGIQRKSTVPVCGKRKAESDTIPSTFAECIMKQGEVFETKVVERLERIFGSKLESIPVQQTHSARATQTIDAMNRGVHVIHGGMLVNTKNNTYGIPD